MVHQVGWLSVDPELLKHIEGHDAPPRSYGSDQPLVKEATYEICATDPQGAGSSGSCKIKLDKDRTLKIKHSWTRAKGQGMAMELSTPKWGFEFMSNNDIALEAKKKTRIGEIRAKQRIPAQKPWLIPSPEFKVIASPLSIEKWKLKDEAEFVYDFQQSVGRFQEEVVYDKRYKAKISADTLKGLMGATLSLSAKLQSPYVPSGSVGMNLSRAAGPVLKLETNFGEDELVKAKADWQLKNNAARLELQPKLSPHTRLVVTALSGPDFQMWEKPKLTLGLKCDM